MKCYYLGVSNKGNAEWGSIERYWTPTINIEDSIVQYCRSAFKDKYRDMWIDPLYFDDKYFRWTDSFFSEVGVLLYPKLTNIKVELQRRGYEVPRNGDKEAWKKYNSVVWEIIHNDINKNINKGVKPIKVIVKGIRSPKDSDYFQKITCIKEVLKLEGEMG